MAKFTRDISTTLGDGNTERFVIQTQGDDAVKVDLSANGQPYSVDIQTASSHPAGAAQFNTGDYSSCMPLGAERYTDTSQHTTATDVVDESVFVAVTNNAGSQTAFTGSIQTHSQDARDSAAAFATEGTGERASAYRDGRGIGNAELHDVESLHTKLDNGVVVANWWVDKGLAGDIVEAIQKATEYVKNNLSRADVAVHPGTYTVDSGTATIPSGFEYGTIGTLGAYGSAEIQYSGNGPIIDTTSGLQNYIAITGISFEDNGGSASSAIKASDHFHMKIVGCLFDGFQSYQINATGNIDWAEIAHNDFRRCNGLSALSVRAEAANGSTRCDIVVSHHNGFTDTSSGCMGIQFYATNSDFRGAFSMHDLFDTVRNSGIRWNGVKVGGAFGISSEGTGTKNNGFSIEDDANGNNSQGIVFRDCYIDGAGRSPDTGVNMPHADHSGVVGGVITGHSTNSVGAGGQSNNCYVRRASLANGALLSSGVGHTDNGVGDESANAETPTASVWEVGDTVDFTDTGDGSGNGVYTLLPDGSWSKIGST